MKVGDIVYFKSTYTARYGKQGGSYEYQLDMVNKVDHMSISSV